MADTTIPAEVSRLETAKSQLASAISAKGVTVPEAAKLDAYPDYVASIPAGGGSPRTYRVVVGTSTAGWTADDCDYLCDGTADQTTISQAIAALPEEGGVVYFLGGTYSLTSTLTISSDNITLLGNHQSSILVNQGSAAVLVSAGDNFAMQDLLVTDERSSGSQATVVINGANYRISGCRFANLNVLSLDISGQDALLQNTDFAAAQITATTGTHNGARVWGCSRTGDTGSTLPWLLVSGNDIDITGNYVCNAYTGINTQTCQKVNIINNYISNCKVGILTSGDIVGHNILNNMILNFVAYGIFTQSMNGQYINVTGNYVALDDTIQTPSGTPIAIAGERNVVTSNITPGKQITTMGSRVLIDNNSY